ncbi:hypothetical protein [Gorillibacterium timonense]|uniref:hypothetical protein n=1 Tax=Gorillibacterium timonense TaxID=1689269 RepID=UPI00071C7E2D|nr:hypothetical protein [Gorillibacterium timonense]
MTRSKGWILLLTAVLLLMGGCATTTKTGVGITTTAVSSELKATDLGAAAEAELPAGYTLAKIRTALEDYINLRLWLYPDRTEGKGTNEFEPYIGQDLEFELRLYTGSDGQKRIYAHADKGKSLVTFTLMDGIVYANGKVTEEESGADWPGQDFQAKGTLTQHISEPHKPDYGSTPHKDKMIAAAKEYAKRICEDLNASSERDQWNKAEVYIQDFYEYETGTALWIVRSDDYAWYSPLSFEESGDTIKAVGVKGFEVKNIHGLAADQLERFMFDRAVSDSITHYRCSEGKLKEMTNP